MESINNRCEMLTCECGGKFQRKALNKHAGSKMHINFRLKREAEAEKEMLDRLKREAEETIMHINLKPTPEEDRIIKCDCGVEFQYQNRADHFETKMHIRFMEKQDEECRREEIEYIKERELRDNNAEVEAWKAEEEEENARLANIPAKKSCVVKIQVSKEFKTREERVKFDLEASGSIARLEQRVESRGGNFGRFRSEVPSPPFWADGQPGFR